MTLGMLVQIGLSWLALSLLAGLFWAVLRDQEKRAYEDGYKNGIEDAWADACRLRAVK